MPKIQRYSLDLWDNATQMYPDSNDKAEWVRAEDHEKAVAELIDRIRERELYILKLQKDRNLLIGMTLQYGRCRSGCPWPESKGKEKCTCGWVEDAAEVGAVVFGVTDLLKMEEE